MSGAELPPRAWLVPADSLCFHVRRFTRTFAWRCSDHTLSCLLSGRHTSYFSARQNLCCSLTAGRVWMPTVYFASQTATVLTQPQRRRGCASPRQGFQEHWAGWGLLLALAAGGEGLPAGKSSGVNGRRRNRVIYPCCGFLGGSEVKNLPVNAGDIRDVGSVLGWGRSPGGGRGNPLQYSCLENPVDRGAWRATVGS